MILSCFSHFILKTKHLGLGKKKKERKLISNNKPWRLWKSESPASSVFIVLLLCIVVVCSVALGIIPKNFSVS